MPTFFFAGGGTGGHIYPGLAIAQRLAELEPGARSVFLVSRRAIDAVVVREAGLQAIALPAQPLSLGPRGLLRFVGAWGPSIRAARAAITGTRRDHGEPLHLVAMGGFVAPPAVQAARVEKLGVTLVNLDAVPGRANRWIGARTPHRFSAADSPAVPGSWTRVRPLVRAQAVPPGDAAFCRRALDLDPALPTLLVTGGSQGAASLNALVAFLLERHAELFAGWQVIHQTGEGAAQRLAEAYRKASVPCCVREFIPAMGVAWGAAELAIARCGAGTVGEVWASAVPTLFLPYPYHRDDHQRLNAAPLVRTGGAVVVTDRVDPATTATDILPVLKTLLQSPSERVRRSVALAGLGPADGALTVARALLDRIVAPRSALA